MYIFYEVVIRDYIYYKLIALLNIYIHIYTYIYIRLLLSNISTFDVSHLHGLSLHEGGIWRQKILLFCWYSAWLSTYGPQVPPEIRVCAAKRRFGQRRTAYTTVVP